ncbi:MAG: hypothetical protein JWQ20_1336 [Conexibacter sp.]|nr:hypothetical protein [Conexibacter sp.]
MPLFAQRFLTPDPTVQQPVGTFDASRQLRIDSFGNALVAGLWAIGPTTTRGEVDSANSLGEIVTKAEADKHSPDWPAALPGPIKTSAGADRSTTVRM